MSNQIQGFIVASIHETDRTENVQQLINTLPALSIIEAVYPTKTKIPFKKQLLELSFLRTGKALSNGELGCLLSHRQIWRKIVSGPQNPTQMFLILESDSSLNHVELIQQQFPLIASKYDLFFWGAWEGHMKLFKSTIQKITDSYSIGQPFIKTTYCTYGYSINKRAAELLLERTSKINYPVDQFKHFISQHELMLGGVCPELISTLGKQKSYIQPNRNKVKEFLLMLLLDCRNSIICFFR